MHLALFVDGSPLHLPRANRHLEPLKVGMTEGGGDQGDEEAKRVIDEYTDYLACGLANLINGLQPEVVSIGGGIGKQGERLLAPLRVKVEREIYKGIKLPKIVSCTLGYKAGLIGAAMSAR